MSINRRSMLKLAGAIPLIGLGKASYAQQYPSRPIHVVVPASAATSIDATARYFSEPLTRRLKVPVVVENKPGTGGLLAYTAVAKTAADGYTIMLAGIPLYLLPLLSQGSATFDARKDFTPVTRVARVALGVVVSSESPYKTLEELIQALKDQPGELTYSSQGIGSAAHLCCALFTHMTGTKAQHIPYKSTTTATTDVAAGRISFTIQSPPAILGLIDAGKLRLLAVTGEQRWPQFPDVRTVQEAGVADFEASSWLDFIAPKGIPQPVVELLNREIVSIAGTPEYAEFCKQQSFAPDIVDYRQVASEMDAEAAKWKRIVDVALAE